MYRLFWTLQFQISDSALLAVSLPKIKETSGPYPTHLPYYLSLSLSACLFTQVRQQKSLAAAARSASTLLVPGEAVKCFSSPSPDAHVD